MLLLWLGACATDDSAKTPVDSDPATTPTCRDVAAPTLSSTKWELSGPVPAIGMDSLAALHGEPPVWVGSHMTGVWTGDDDLAWEASPVTITHTLSEIALRDDNPQAAYRSSGGKLSRTKDRGQTWEDMILDPENPNEIPTIWAIASTRWQPDRLLMVEKDGSAWVSLDDGVTSTWMGYASFRAPPADDNPAMTFGWRLLPEAEEGGRIFLGDGFGLSSSDDGMITWTRRVDLPDGGKPLLQDPLDPGHLVLGTTTGWMDSADNGETWVTHTLEEGVSVGAWAPDGSWLALVGDTAVFVSTDGGGSFTRTPHTLSMAAAATILADGRLIVAEHHGMSVSADRGVTWTDISAGLVDDAMSVLMTDPDCPNEVWTGSRCGGGLFHSDDYGATWQPVDHYYHYFMGLFDDPTTPGRMWSVSDDFLSRSDDEGVTWETVLQRAHFHGFAAHPEEPETLLLGSVGSGGWGDDRMHVYRSADAGTTWEDSSGGLPTSTASAHAILRWPGKPDVVLLGTYKGEDVSHVAGEGIGLWRSTDSGANWSLALDVHDIAMLTAAPDGVIAATGDGLYRSTDEGQTWAQLPGPSGLILAVSFTGETGVALEQAGSVWVSRDGGDSWTEPDPSIPFNNVTTLAGVGVSKDGTVAYVTVYDHGVYRLGLSE